MNDPDHSRRLLWYAADNLGPEEARELKAHLDACPDCRAQVRFARSLGKSLKRPPGKPGKP
ncbi:MAG: anti-sigma factor family protein [Candidatus Polarisedimenticolia bacterium]